jgi:hypothetical protein
MKSINLRVTKENIQDRDTFFTTYDLLKVAINNPQEGGFTVDEMMKRVRLLNKLEEYQSMFKVEEGKFDDSYLEKSDVLELEDADFLKLKELFRQVKWGVVSKTIIDLHNEIDSL